MRSYALTLMTFILTTALGVPAMAQWSPGQEDQPSSRPGRMGAYAPAGLEAPMVLEARTFLQGRLPSMTLNEVREAYTQVVAGLNVKLVCEVEEEDGPATWQFVAFRSLDGRWHFHSALRLA